MPIDIQYTIYIHIKAYIFLKGLKANQSIIYFFAVLLWSLVWLLHYINLMEIKFEIKSTSFRLIKKIPKLS